MRLHHSRILSGLATTGLLLITAVPTFAAEAVAGATKSRTAWDLVMAGGWAMVPLVALSIVTFGLVIFSFLTLKKSAISTPEFLAAIDAYLKKGDILGLTAQCAQQPDVLARILHATLQFATRNPTAKFSLLREIAQSEGSRQAAKIFQQITYFYDIGVIAPMVGLAGTVTAMIQSFQVIGIEGGGVRPALLANSVSEALICTAAGLVIGIPSMIAYSYFKGKAQLLVSELESQSSHLMAQLEVQAGG